MALLSAWGFTYRSHVAWRKTTADGHVRRGTGHWFANVHELLLLGVRGDLPAPLPGTQAVSVLDAPVGRHSEKPARFRQLIEDYFPGVARLELFAREAALGWDVWGNEVGRVNREHRYRVDRRNVEPAACGALRHRHREREDARPGLAGRAAPVGLAALATTVDAHGRDHDSRVGTGVYLVGDIPHLQAWPFPNVWLGVSVEDQATADARIIPLLLETPAAVRFVSCEPALGPVDFSPKDSVVEMLSPFYGPSGFDESGSQPIRERATWLFRIGRAARATSAPPPECRSSSSNGESGRRTGRSTETRWLDDLENPGLDFGYKVARVGKRRAGRLLDGVLHDGFAA